ncbi:hypothetical protein DFJ74DRAFT_660462 [Hyaloraphidium curvatum]|nr:hypothetical protein DFJ74DRAFT_660462 [Hyaloraphidium curvatum]
MSGAVFVRLRGSEADFTPLAVSDLDLEAIVVEALHLLGVESASQVSIFLLLDSDGNKVEITNQDELSYLVGYLQRQNRAVCFELVAEKSGLAGVDAIVLQHPELPSEVPVGDVTAPQPGSTPPMVADAGDPLDDDDDWLSEDEQSPSIPPRGHTMSANPSTEDPAKRSSYPRVPAIDTVPPSPVASSALSVRSKVSDPEATQAKSKGKEVVTADVEVEVLLPPRKHRLGSEGSDPKGTATPPAPVPAGSTQASPYSTTAHSRSASGNTIASRLETANRGLVGHYRTLQSLANSDPKGPFGRSLGPIVAELGFCVEMITEKCDADIADALLRLVHETSNFITVHRNGTGRAVMSPVAEEHVVEGIFDLLLEEPASAKEAIKKLVRERNDAIAVAAALGDGPAPPMATTSALVADTRDSKSGAASPVPTPSHQSSESSSPLAAPAVPAPRDRVVEPEVAVDDDLLATLSEEQRRQMAEEQDRILQMIRLEQIQRERAQEVASPSNRQQLPAAQQQQQPVPAPKKEPAKLSNLFKRALAPAAGPSASASAQQQASQSQTMPPPPRSASQQPSHTSQPVARAPMPASAMSLEQAHQILVDMGFSDSRLNAEVLQRCGGDFTRVVEELVARDGAPQGIMA